MSGPDGIAATVRATFAEVLAQDGIADSDNFFSRGGNSLDAVRMLAALRERGLDVTVRDVMADPTPAGIARSLLHKTDRS
jgi:aryl carrier-like protein